MTPDRARPPGLSVRVKLTLSYAGFLVVAGIALFAVGFFLLRYIPDGNLWLSDGGFVPSRTDLLEVFLKYAWWAMGGLVVFGLVGGWLLAGVVLRPLERITAVARSAGDGDLDRRIDLAGPRDELTDLADAFDAMLGRVQRTLDEERRFAANASHELRTPHAIIRTLVEVGEADPAGRDVDTLLRRIGTTNDRAIALTEALLLLARGGGFDARPVDLAALVDEAVDENRTDAAARGIRTHLAVEPAVVSGERTLVARLVSNLVRNAVLHNVPDGDVWVSVTTDATTDASAVVLTVRNTGAVIAPMTAATLTEPFVRGAGRTRTADGPQGSGLGLAIVAAVVRAHRGALEVRPREGGGLTVAARLPRA
ncbi:sensor histidine kinase [Microbacterium sp. CJ88]|uniref:sensor histidine kinase n=1 Tax=Microbacterium sp. CJ88 TaxID=3445672 RepID=UPI003F65A584